MKNLAILTLLATLIALSGCQTTNQAPQVAQRTSAVFNASKDKVWPLLVAEVGLNYPVAAVEKESGLLTTDFVMMPAGYNNMNMTQWVFNPGGFLATWNGLRMKMNIMVVEIEPGKTQVTIRAHYEAFENNVSKSWIVCRTNGSMENSILTSIENQIR
jgi:outer membrane lipoprotein-sorting protein